MSEDTASQVRIEPEKLHTIPEYAKMKNVDVSTVYRWINSSKIRTKKVQGKLYVVEQASEEIKALVVMVETLQEQIKQKDKEINALQESTQQQNAIIMQMSRAQEQLTLSFQKAHNLIEDKRPFWRRLFRHSVPEQQQD